MSDLWLDIEPDNDSSNYGSIDEGGKYQENPDYQEQEKVVLFSCRNPRRIRRVDLRALRQLKIYIKISKDKLFFIKHVSSGLTHAKWNLVQVDMYQSDPFLMRNYGVYLF